jgi:hypothetical protein
LPENSATGRIAKKDKQGSCGDQFLAVPASGRYYIANSGLAEPGFMGHFSFLREWRVSESNRENFR